MKVSNYIDPTAEVHFNVKVWHYAIVQPGAVLSTGVSIGSHAEIGRDSFIGPHTRISKGVFLPARSRVGARVFIGPNVTFTDDRYPRVGNADYHPEPPVIDDDVAIGAGAVILPGVHIGRGALIGAGTIVTCNVPPRIVLRENLSHSSTARSSEAVVPHS